MCRLGFVFLFWVFVSLFVGAGELEIADNFFNEGKYVDGAAYLQEINDVPGSAKRKGEVFWRLARFQLYAAEEMKTSGAEKSVLLAMYKQGIEYADKAIMYGAGANAYMWRASNTGSYGEVKGMFDALHLAGDMKKDLLKILEIDPSFSGAWHALAMLYYRLPGWPLAFGNLGFAISLSRRAVKTMWSGDLQVIYLTGLAEMLYKRNWPVEKRIRRINKMVEQSKKEKSFFSKMCYYESTLAVSSTYSTTVPVYSNLLIMEMSDREEAGYIVRWLLEKDNSVHFKGALNHKELEHAGSLLLTWR